MLLQTRNIPGPRRLPIIGNTIELFRRRADFLDWLCELHAKVRKVSADVRGAASCALALTTMRCGVPWCACVRACPTLWVGVAWWQHGNTFILKLLPFMSPFIAVADPASVDFVLKSKFWDFEKGCVRAVCVVSRAAGVSGDGCVCVWSLSPV